MAGGSVPITVATSHSGSVNVYLGAIGTVNPHNTVAITSQVTGLVTAVNYREGQLVQKGDSLLDVDSRPFEATVQQAEGILERDRNVLEEAKMDLTRYQLAWSKNAIPRQTLEDQEKVVLQEQGTIKNDEGVVQYDKVQLGYCHIVSPITGRVGLRLVDPGNLVTANSTTTLLVVTPLQPITVVFTLAEDSLPQVLHQSRGSHQLKSEEHTSELQSPDHLVCRLLLEKTTSASWQRLPGTPRGIFPVVRMKLFGCGGFRASRPAPSAGSVSPRTPLPPRTTGFTT